MTDGTGSRIDVVCVAYNRSVTEIPAVAAALESPLVSQVIVIDNSTDSAILERNARELSGSIVYAAMGGNAGLSRAYNCGLAMVRARPCQIFDHDTRVREGHFEKVLDWVGNRDVDILVPQVSVDGRPFSPCRRIGPTYRPAFGRSVPRSKFSAINSGIVLASDRALRYRYDERLFLDFIDHRFFEDARANQWTWDVMSDVVLDQDFSELTDDTAQARRRMAIFMSDAREFYRRQRFGGVKLLARTSVRRAKQVIKRVVS